MTPSTVQEIFDGMPSAFRPHKAEGVEMVYQFHITGEDTGDWTVSIAGGQCSVSPGTHPDPTATLTLSDKNWLKLVAGKLQPGHGLDDRQAQDRRRSYGRAEIGLSVQAWVGAAAPYCVAGITRFLGV